MSLKKNKRTTADLNEVDDEIMSIINSEEYSRIPTKEEAEFIAEFTEIKKFRKGTLLLREGQIAKACYYVFKGCVREYRLKDGLEITSEFYTAGDSLSDDTSKLNRLPSVLNWECMVDCIISVVPFEAEVELYKSFPRLETMCRIEMERRFGDFKQAVTMYQSSTPEERYDNLLKTRPEIFALVPLYHIASYLGVKPESLSRIRNRMRNAAR